MDVVRRVKAANPSALYVCDPVMGHPAKGCVVPQGVQTHHALKSGSFADVLCPNVLELGIMTGRDVRSPAEVRSAVHALLAAGSAQMVLVKHLAHAGFTPDTSFEMLLITRGGEEWHISTPLLPFTKAPVGVGDLTTALFLAATLQGRTPREALEHTASAYMDVMRATSALDEYELQLIAAQDGLAEPTAWVEARPLGL